MTRIPIEVWTDQRNFIVIGPPPVEPPADPAQPRPPLHDCRAMGCWSDFHILARIPVACYRRELGHLVHPNAPLALVSEDQP